MAQVLVLFNAPTLPADHPDAVAERDVLNSVEIIHGYLAEAGYEARRLGISANPGPLVEWLATEPPDAVFNLFEGTAVMNQTEATVAGILEWHGVPFTGCPMSAMVVCRQKALVKNLLRGAELPTADFVLIDDEPALASVAWKGSWPVFVKPANEDASVGIELGSVVATPLELRERLRWLARRYRPPFLVEAYLPGREFNVGVIDDPTPIVLPVSEIVFAPPTDDPSWKPVVTYASKWQPGSAEDLAALPRCPAAAPPALAEELRTLALAAYRLTGCRDYARVDLRLDAAGKPNILEVNPNPDFSPDAGLARALAASGRGHREFALRLVERLLKRP
jgi:D-alanine-D-alanine ligase